MLVWGTYVESIVFMNAVTAVCLIRFYVVAASSLVRAAVVTGVVDISMVE